MKIYKLDQRGIIGGRENNSHIYIKNLSLDTDYRDKGFHSHPDTDEYYIVLEGSILFEHAQGTEKIESSESICFLRGEIHLIAKVERPTKVIIIKSTDFQLSNESNYKVHD